ncbi:hypothetical protein ACLKA6_016315 [Drosophila palustris]
MNCVKECRALISSPRQRNYLTAAALFGLYCGVLLYRSYTKYLAEVHNKKEEAIDLEAEEIQSQSQSEDSYVFDPPPVTSKELLLPPIIYDTTTENFGGVQLTQRPEIEPIIRGSM